MRKKSSAIRNTFKAYERLKREQHIDTLFRTGKAFSVFPVKFISLILPLAEGELSPVRVCFSVPKKKFKRAADRNRIKRLMREAWRMNKHPLYDSVPESSQMHVFLIFTDNKLPDHTIVTNTIMAGMSKLVARFAPDTNA